MRKFYLYPIVMAILVIILGFGYQGIEAQPDDLCFSSPNRAIVLTTPTTNDDGTPLLNLEGVNVYALYDGEAQMELVGTLLTEQTGVQTSAPFILPRVGRAAISTTAFNKCGNESNFTQFPQSVVYSDATPGACSIEEVQ